MRQRLTILISLILLVAVGVGIYLAVPYIFGSLVVQIPDEYKARVQKYADEAGIDPCFLASIIQAESRWRPEARSGVGASGLGQLTPGTAASIARVYSIAYHGEIFDPDKNMELASLLIKYNFDNYGSIRNVLVAYNAGGGRVRLPDNSLPRETQRYIRTVSTYYSVFRSNPAYNTLCIGSGNGLGQGGVTLPTGQKVDFPDFPDVSQPPQNVNINDLWKTFLGF